MFRTALERCEQALCRHVDWSLLDEIRADAATSRLEELDVVQPVLFAVQVALAALWRSWGVEPDAVVGHSMGEVAAAHVAGILGLDDAARIICRRSQMVRRRASGEGRMAVCEPAGRSNGGAPRRLGAAACRRPHVTGRRRPSSPARRLRWWSWVSWPSAADIFFQLVKVDYASHSPQMEPLREELLEALGMIDPRPTTIAMMSTSARPTLIDGP